MIRKTESLNRRHHACFKEMVTSLKEGDFVWMSIELVDYSTGETFIFL